MIGSRGFGPAAPAQSGPDPVPLPGMSIPGAGVIHIIPVMHGPFCCLNVEDGVALADENLRRELAGRYPAVWDRIEARRTFIRDAVGIDLDPCVLPMSNMPAWMPPFALDLNTALAA